MTYESDLRKFNRIRQKGYKSDYSSRHFMDRVSERNISFSDIKHIFKHAKIKGFIDQEDSTYKVIFEFNQDKDLNIVVNLSASRTLKLVTVYLSLLERRRRI